MKFLIERASDLSGMKQPCEGATLLHLENGMLETALWEIEVDSMEELLSMVDLGCNGIVIDKTTHLDYKYRITIYDDYIE